MWYDILWYWLVVWNHCFTVAPLNTYLYDAMTNIFHLLWSKKLHEQLADGVLQKSRKENFTGSTLKLGGVKNRPVFVILFRPNLQLIVYLQYSGEPVSTLWKADCKFLVTQYLESYVAGKSLHKCLLLLLTKRLLDAVMLCFFSQVR